MILSSETWVHGGVALIKEKNGGYAAYVDLNALIRSSRGIDWTSIERAVMGAQLALTAEKAKAIKK